jgi:putative phosphoribosyl transferase
MFANRQKAGQELAQKLEHYKDRKDTIVIGLPRGGVEVAFEVAFYLHLPLDILCTAKIKAPQNKELAIGAISENELVLDDQFITNFHVPKEYLDKQIGSAKGSVNRCMEQYQTLCPPFELKGKTVILIDDGLATGFTMRVAIETLVKKNVSKIVPAVPVASEAALSKIEEKIEEAFTLKFAPEMYAVGQYYKDFAPTSEEKVAALLFKNRQSIES